MNNPILQGILKKTRQGSNILLVGSGAAQAIDLGSTVVLAHYLGLKGYGILVAARASSGVVSCLLSARSSEVLLAFLPRFERSSSKDQASSIYSLCVGAELILGLVGLGVCYLIGPLLPAILPESKDLSFWILPFAFNRHWGNTLIGNNQALLRLRQRYWLSASQTVLAPLFRLFGLLAVVAFGKGLALCAFVDGTAALASWLTGGLVLHLIEPARLSWRSLRELRGYARAIWDFSRVNWAAASAKALAGYGAEMTLVSLASAESVGAFGVARRLAATLVLVVDPLIQTATPEIYRLAAHDDFRTIRKFVGAITGYSLVVLPVLNILLFVFRDQITTLVGGSSFNVASTPLMILAIAFSIHISLGWLRPLILAVHKPRIILISQLVMGLVGVSVSWWLVPEMSATGAAIAVLAGYLAQLAICSISVRGLLLRTD